MLPSGSHGSVAKLAFCLLALTSACGGGGGGDATGPGTPPPQPTSFTVAIGGTGAGSGTVTSVPTGISCTIAAGATTGSCSAAFVSGTTVSFTATAVTGSTFDGWSGPCVGTAVCSVTVTTGTALQVAFGLPQIRTLAITPRVALLPLGAATTLTFEARDATNALIATPALTAASRNPDVVSASGSAITANKSGSTFVVFSSGAVSDSVAAVALAGNGFAVMLGKADSYTATATAGSTVTVDLILVRPPNAIGDIAALQGSIVWDPAKLTLVDAQGLASGWTWLTNAAAATTGQLSFGGFAPEGTATNFSLARLTFTAIGASGSTSPLSLRNLSAGNSSGADISSQIQRVNTQLSIQ